ncbi:hypothetical protein Mgra_00006519 [Meloidogyne graminicola]|uniref:Uncharacterized protein n=1 Tax=Meloidogyne graminicola TaxID=189291 RepID=A0A8S9ZL71_9BILA|nr:hypothetical protein Mgra_00006519 [Meloidogyne graminicola]
MVLAFWLENCALLLPYLLMQFIGIGSFLTILLALLYIVVCWRYFRDKQTFFIQNNRDTTCIILHPINQINIENKNLN